MIGFLDTPSGISGDMFLGCLVDAGWPLDELRAVLGRLKLPAGSWAVDARDVMKGPLRAKLVDVRVAEPAPAAHKFVLAANHGHGGTAHRNLHDVRAIIDAADLKPIVKSQAIAVFTRLAHAEAKVHGTAVEQVHFHEVGALDAIVDIVGTVCGLDALGITRLHASPLPLGRGWGSMAHGTMPLPAPATLELLAAARAPTCPAPGPGELVTPTGAALLAELATFTQPAMTLSRIGLGAGQKDFPWPNLARLWLGPSPEGAAPHANAGDYVQVETNIDDMNPQFYPVVSERLFTAGARDVWLTPIQMKKGRPAVTLSVLAPAALEPAMVDLLLRETTTLGVRVRAVRKHAARREHRTVATPYGPIPVKLKWVGDDLAGAAPEYEDCRRAADLHRVPVSAVYEAALAAQREAGAAVGTGKAPDCHPDGASVA